MQFQADLEQLLDLPELNRKELRAVIASLATIAGTSKQEFSPDETLLKLSIDTAKPPRIRALALQSINVNHKNLTVETLASLAD